MTAGRTLDVDQLVDGTVGRFGFILGQVLGGALIQLHVPPRGLFLGAAAPMLLGAAAAAGLIGLWRGARA